MTFSAPKSASLLFVLGDERTSAAVRQAHDEAVRAALGYMEREACVVRSGKAGRGGKEAGEGFVGGLFRHRTSRALDPQLHTHAVAANLAKRSDGRYIALDGTALFQQAKTGGCLYQAELRARLTEYLGVEWNQVRNGAAEIKGVARPVIDHFSKRRAQIVEAMSQRRSGSARSAQEAALETRPGKRQVDLEQLVAEWRSVAAELGFGRAELEQLTGRVVQRPQLAREELRQLATELAGLTRWASTFDRRSTVQAFCGAHAYGATVARLEHLADRFLESGHVLPVEGQPAVSGPDTIRRRDGPPRSAGRRRQAHNTGDARARGAACQLGLGAQKRGRGHGRRRRRRGGLRGAPRALAGAGGDGALADAVGRWGGGRARRGRHGQDLRARRRTPGVGGVRLPGHGGGAVGAGGVRAARHRRDRVGDRGAGAD